MKYSLTISFIAKPGILILRSDDREEIIKKRDDILANGYAWVEGGVCERFYPAHSATEAIILTNSK